MTRTDRPLRIALAVATLLLAPAGGQSQRVHDGGSRPGARDASTAELERVTRARFREVLSDPSPARIASFRQALGTASPGGGGNVMETLFLVFRESIQEQNEDKRYWLEKLKSSNEMGDALSDYIQELSELSGQLGAGRGGAGGGACLEAASNAEAAADRLAARLARRKRAFSPEQRADVERLERTIARERDTLRAMRRLVDELSRTSATRTSPASGPVRPVR